MPLRLASGALICLASQRLKWRICRVEAWLEQKEETGGERAGAAGEDDRAGRF
jgi:hypothetical protein